MTEIPFKGNYLKNTLIVLTKFKCDSCHCILNKHFLNFQNLSKTIFFLNLFCIYSPFQIWEGMHTQKYFVQWTYLNLEKLFHAISLGPYDKIKIKFI